MPLRERQEVQKMLWRRHIGAGSSAQPQQQGMRERPALKSIWLVAAALCSGGLLYAAFPPLEWAEGAWIALLPLFFCLMRVSPRAGARLGLATGAVYWWPSLFWLTEVTWVGWFLLALYCALYMGAFGYLTALCWQRYPVTRGLGIRLLSLLGVPLIWAGLEFMRSVWLTGFAWNPLGNSQYTRIALIQLSALTGVYGVSALVVVVNLAIALTLDRYVRASAQGRRPAWHPELLAGLVILALAWGYGQRVLATDDPAADQPLRLAVIQPNIPQYVKWSPEFVNHIYTKLESLTTLAIETGQPDLVVWPETALPDYVRESERSYALVRELTQLGAPLLVGSMDIEWEESGRPRYYNSSMLFDAQGRLVTTYDKIHLVMFGEYVPLQRFIPFINAMTPIEASFNAGREHTVFRVPGTEHTFAVLICFEDTVARVSRAGVRNGARLLINQTNVAWFRTSPASQQHITHSVFRAVENRVPLVRAANTGVSGGIDRFGRIHNVLTDGTGNTFISGFATVPVTPPPEDHAHTVYTRYGDWFGWLGLIWAGLWAAIPITAAGRRWCRRHPRITNKLLFFHRNRDAAQDDVLRKQENHDRRD